MAKYSISELGGVTSVIQFPNASSRRAGHVFNPELIDVPANHAAVRLVRDADVMPDGYRYFTNDDIYYEMKRLPVKYGGLLQPGATAPPPMPTWRDLHTTTGVGDPIA